MSNMLNMKRRGGARTLVLGKRVKNLWGKSEARMSLKEWARSSGDPDAKAWLEMKAAPVVRKEKVKIQKKSKAEKAAEKQGKKK